MAEAIEIRVPDIGDFEQVEVVEILVAKGDRVAVEDSVVSIESDKATMEIPSPVAGTVDEVRVSLGDAVSEGTLLMTILPDVDSVEAEAGTPQAGAEAGGEAEQEAPAGAAGAGPPPLEEEAPAAPGAAPTSPERVPAPGQPPEREPPVREVPAPRGPRPHASPLVRGVARELGVALDDVNGSGPHGRILDEDVKSYVRGRLEGGAAGPALSLATAPEIDHSRWGPVEEVPLGKVRRVSARNLTRSWLTAPHVTQHDEADVTELERFRRSRRDEAAARDVKLSPLHFVMKAVAVALRDFPDLRSSLSADGERLIVKQSIHLGVAVDTENGLLVPVVRDVDRQGVYALAEALSELAEKARARKLAPGDMQGACFSISSLGGIGGTAFTPIVNTPEVAILGLSKLAVRPVWSGGMDADAVGGVFEPRVMMPLSLSYDHRVIDGAVAVRFTTRLVRLLSHPANLLL